MIASFLVIFAAFSVCQALITVKYADFLSPASDASAAAGSAHDVGTAKLA